MTAPEQRTAIEQGPFSATETVPLSRQEPASNKYMRVSNPNDAFDAALATESGMLEPSPPRYSLVNVTT